MRNPSFYRRSMVVRPEIIYRTIIMWYIGWRICSAYSYCLIVIFEIFKFFWGVCGNICLSSSQKHKASHTHQYCNTNWLSQRFKANATVRIKMRLSWHYRLLRSYPKPPPRRLPPSDLASGRPYFASATRSSLPSLLLPSIESIASSASLRS